MFRLLADFVFALPLSLSLSFSLSLLTLFSNKALEVSLAVTPRSTWAFNNSPEGNYAHISWKTGDAPKGVTVESNTGSYEVWTKTTRSPGDLQLFWRTQLCASCLLSP